MSAAQAGERRIVGGFVGGVICTQFANSAYHIAQPLLMAELTGSIGYAAFFASFDTAVHMGGTFLGGWPVDRLGARRVLIAATFLRGLVLAVIPFCLLQQSLTAVVAMAWYTLDALIRGFVDAAVFTLPMEFAEHEVAELDRFNSRYEVAFDLGGIAGPLAFSALAYWFQGVAAHAFVALGMIVAAIVYAVIPSRRRESSEMRTRPQRQDRGSVEGLKAVLRDRTLLTSCLGYMSFNIYPLRKLLSAFFAKEILFDPAAAGFLGSAFSFGGLCGSLVYARWRDFGVAGLWIILGSAGLVGLGFSWVPASLGVMSFVAFVFAFTNTGARLTLIRMRQERTPLQLAGGVTAVSRFMANAVSVVAKALVGLALTLGKTPTMAFSLVGVLLLVIALVQVGVLLRARADLVAASS